MLRCHYLIRINPITPLPSSRGLPRPGRGCGQVALFACVGAGFTPDARLPDGRLRCGFCGCLDGYTVVSWPWPQLTWLSSSQAKPLQLRVQTACSRERLSKDSVNQSPQTLTCLSCLAIRATNQSPF